MAVVEIWKASPFKGTKKHEDISNTELKHRWGDRVPCQAGGPAPAHSSQLPCTVAMKAELKQRDSFHWRSSSIMKI